MLPNGLPRFCRLHLQRDFKEVFKGGIRLRYRGLVMWVRKNPACKEVRFAVVVSKKLGTAVVRNRAKRLLREAFRSNRKQIIAGTDIILRPQDSEKLSTVQAAQYALMTLCGRAAILKDLPNETKTEG